MKRLQAEPEPLHFPNLLSEDEDEKSEDTARFDEKRPASAPPAQTDGVEVINLDDSGEGEEEDLPAPPSQTSSVR